MSGRHGGTYAALAVASGLILHVAAGNFVEHGAWVVAISVLAAASPVALASIYIATAWQTGRLEIFAARGWIHFLLSRRPLKILFWTGYAFASAYFMLLQMYAYQPRQWAAFFLVAPVLLGAYLVTRRVTFREVKPYLANAIALHYARHLASAAMVLLHLAALLWFAPTETPHSTLAEAIDHERRALTALAGSAIVFESANAMAWYLGASAFAVGALSQWQASAALVVAAVGSWVVYFNACSVLACFLISPVEYRRVFGPLTNAAVPEPLHPARVGIIAAVLAVVVIFLYLPGVAAIEARLQADDRFREHRGGAERIAHQIVERIDGAYYAAGTSDRLREARDRLLLAHAEACARMEEEANRAFDTLAGGVDPFLDWYYSLTAEYLRIANVLTGNLEDYLREKLADHLRQREAFGRYEEAVRSALADHGEALAAFHAATRRILDENRVPAPPVGAPVRDLALDELLRGPGDETFDLNRRMGAAGGTGAAGGVVTGAIISKILAKSSLKLAAQAVAKAAAGKAASSMAGAGAGAAVGAAVGSVVPIVGTVAGAAVGGVVGGFATMVAVDAGLLKLEEYWSREDFRADLLANIESARGEFLAGLNCAPDP